MSPARKTSPAQPARKTKTARATSTARPAESSSGAPAKPRYAPHPMLAREKVFEAELEAATGKSLAHWIAVARESGPPKATACRKWLETTHGIGGHAAWWVASYATGGDDPLTLDDPEALVAALYSGAREPLRALHEQVVDAAVALGDDVVVTACKTMVPLYRKHVFAELRPVEGGVAVELALGEEPATGRLEAATNRAPGDRMSHRVVVRTRNDVDAELRAWLAKAYGHGAGRMSRGPTDVETPADLAKAIRASKPAGATWASCTPAMRRDMIQWVVAAKQADTRARRVDRCADALAAGRRRVY